ncbi:hypothetical protein AAFF_G00254730 [Aldrovandia affinis]|uniref:Uncharacterized protein n=1 Tax=Aldrovandia affinis TaxID=143900 RepID=A0AAD7W3M5_9TELE|nr:hypothetical protein AAFF_G00254730 [Aldrovandia affinis]
MTKLTLLAGLCLVFCQLELPPLPPTTTLAPGGTTSATTTTKATTLTPCATTTTTVVPGSGFCSGKPDGLYINPNNANAFYQCAHGRT